MIALCSPCLVDSDQFFLKLSIRAMHSRDVNAECISAFLGMEKLSILDGDALPAALEEDIIVLGIEDTFRAEANARAAPFIGLQLYVIIDEEFAHTHERNAPAMLATVFCELIEHALDTGSSWLTERISTNDRDSILDFEGQCSGAGPVDEESVAVI